MENQNAFVRNLELRIKSFVIQVLQYCGNLPYSTSTKVINYQLIKSVTSTGANHRASGRARSKAEFYSKMCITVEEADETQYWLELIKESNLGNKPEKLEQLLTESEEILKILVKAKHTVKRR